MRFAPGDVVLRRQFQHDLLSRVWVGTVVADDEDGLWLWVATGSPHRDLDAADGRHIREVPTLAEWRAVPKAFNERPWAGDVLMLHPRDGDHSVWIFSNPFRWYVNLERPVVRWRDGTTAGVDTVDYDLDIVAGADRSWRWKDEEEFAARLREPDLYWSAPEHEVRAEGERVIKRIEAAEFPFDGGHARYRADPAWPVPATLPPGWDRPRAR